MTHASGEELPDLFDDHEALSFLAASLDATLNNSSSYLHSRQPSAAALAQQPAAAAREPELAPDLEALLSAFNCGFEQPSSAEGAAAHDSATATATDCSASHSAEKEEHEGDDDDEWTLEKKKTIGRHSRRREELVYLRRKVQELEAKVSTLTQKQAPGLDETAFTKTSSSSESPLSFSAFTSKRDNTGALWENMAAGQLHERQRAELHNKKLRSALETQLQVARSLEKILKKRGTFETLVDSSEARKRVKMIPGALGDNEMSVFDELLGEMDLLYADTDKMLQAAQMHTESHTLREILVKPDPVFGLVMEILESVLLPVEPAVAYRTMWRFAGEKGVNDINYYEVKTETNSNVCKRTFGVKFSRGSDSARFRGTQASKKFLEERRMVIASKSVMSSIEPDESPAAGLVFHESKWTVLSLLASSPDTSFSKLPVTLCQTCSLLIPKCWGPNLKTGLLTDFVTTSWEKSNETSDQLVENMLLEELAKLQL